MGSLAGTSAFEVKVSLSCPDSGLGWGASSDIAIGNCCVAFAVAGTDGAENVDSGGSTAKLKVFANDVEQTRLESGRQQPIRHYPSKRLSAADIF